MLCEIGEEGQNKLCSSSVLVIGAGGLGSAVLPYLAGAGVGTIGICDADTVNLSNLQRQVLYSTNQIGTKKAQLAALRISELNTGIKCRVYDDFLSRNNAETIISPYDLVIDCCDNFSTRYLIDDICLKLEKPWVYGSIGEFKGQVALMGGKNKLRYVDLFPMREELENQPRSVLGVLGAVPGITGTIQACEAIKWLVGLSCPLDGSMLIMDFKTMDFTKIKFL